jgi:alpha-galactosidase
MKIRASSKAWFLCGAAGLAAVLSIAGGSPTPVAAAAAAQQSDQQTAAFTGRWVAEVDLPQGAKREITFFLTQTGDSLSGAVLTGYRMQTVSEGRVRGNEASWAVVTQAGDRQRRVEYRAQLAGEQLTITSSSSAARGTSQSSNSAANAGRSPDGASAARGGVGSPQTLLARRISTDGTPVAPFADLPKETLPALHPVSDGGLAKTPPMGWNSWNHFHGAIDDKTVREIAAAMVSTGMKDAGYLYVNIDDTWEGSRDDHGNIQTNSKFPDMKALADYVHSKGLKLGLYSSPGPKTCAGYEGSYLHEQQDAKTWASWGIDYLKYDWCSASVIFQPDQMQAVYQQMGEALRSSGRPMVFSLCQYGQQAVQSWGPQVGGNLWRTTDDIADNWKSMSALGFDLQTGLEKFAGPGHWNDPDMLEIGNGGMNETEYRTHLSLWALLAAPLLAGNDLRNMTAATREILTNREVIAIDQDSAGHQGYRTSKNGDQEVWAKPLAHGDWAVGLFNRGETPATVLAKWSDLGISGKYKVRDLWEHHELGASEDSFSAEVPPHGVVLLRLFR